MTEELKPCPFCGCKVKFVIGILGERGAPDYYMIEHPQNKCIIEDFRSFYSLYKEKLAKAWNRRIEE